MLARILETLGLSGTRIAKQTTSKVVKTAPLLKGISLKVVDTSAPARSFSSKKKSASGLSSKKKSASRLSSHFDNTSSLLETKLGHRTLVSAAHQDISSRPTAEASAAHQDVASRPTAEQIEKHVKYKDCSNELVYKLTRLKNKIRNKYPKEVAENIVTHLKLDLLCEQINKTPTPEELIENLKSNPKTILLIEAPWGLNTPIKYPLAFLRLEKAINPVKTAVQNIREPLPLIMDRIVTLQEKEENELAKPLKQIKAGLNELIDQYKKTKKSTDSNAEELFNQYQLDLITYKLNQCKDWKWVKAVFEEHEEFRDFLENEHWGLGVKLPKTMNGMLTQDRLYNALKEKGVIKEEPTPTLSYKSNRV